MKKFAAYVEKRETASVDAKNLTNEIRECLNIPSLKSVRKLNKYYVTSDTLSEEEFLTVTKNVFSEVNTDMVYEELPRLLDGGIAFAVESLPGQFNQRVNASIDATKLVIPNFDGLIGNSEIYILDGDLKEDEIARIKKLLINPVDSHEVPFNKDEINTNYEEPRDIETISEFIDFTDDEISELRKAMSLAMSFEDLKFIQNYFKSENRDPSITEIKVIDTYWSDHCRHTTFLTEFNKVNIEDAEILKTYKLYQEVKGEISSNKPETLMDVATIAAKYLVKNGYVKNLDISDEVNACSILVPVDVDGETEIWSLQFKNETHNHPTEIEPFGGAATCLGGAIRDPLSGRTYVYQAARVSGSADPRLSVLETLEGKLPQKKITTGAANGYSSYGNQIGLATGLVNEKYHPNYVAKRLEIGAVVGAAPATDIVRETPLEGDIILLIGGKTGRDGIGGATGSSKEHSATSIETCGAEVQKGNAPTERKIQRLFRNSEVSKLIKRCNDFGAGGVSVAIGELADSLNIDLDKVPKKYEGLDGTELAISESQERMAVVVSPENLEQFYRACKEENIEVTNVANVTNDGRLRMFWRGNEIVNLSRDFLNSNGPSRNISVKIDDFGNNPFSNNIGNNDFEEKLIDTLSQLNVCSQKGLAEKFDSTIGGGTVSMPFGGKHQKTPSIASVCKLPTKGETNTTSILTYGFNPELSDNEYLMAMYSVVESISKTIAVGGKLKDIRLSLQEYFPRLREDEKRWGKPLAALLGAFKAQMELKVPAIGGKDSMSGSFEKIDVPSTLVSFAVTPSDKGSYTSQELKNPNSNLYLYQIKRNANGVPDFEALKGMYQEVEMCIKKGIVESCSVVDFHGIAPTVAKMAFGNKIGVVLNNEVDLFKPEVGSIIVETSEELNNAIKVGSTNGQSYIMFSESTNKYLSPEKLKGITLDKALEVWEKPLEKVFPIKAPSAEMYNFADTKSNVTERTPNKPAIITNKPKVVIPVFPGSNCEYDLEKQFAKSGANVEQVVINNLSQGNLKDSINKFADTIKTSQILTIPGGFSAGDEPDGSAKYIAAFLRNTRVKEAVTEMLDRGGLILGICNGFQALIKSGLLPYGEIKDLNEESPSLVQNSIGRHISQLVNVRVEGNNKSPWLKGLNGQILTIPVSHGEGRFIGSENVIKGLVENCQIATRYVDLDGKPTGEVPYNPNGSIYAIEGITSLDGRIYGGMAHHERITDGTFENCDVELSDTTIFENGVNYFREDYSNKIEDIEA